MLRSRGSALCLMNDLEEKWLVLLKDMDIERRKHTSGDVETITNTYGVLLVGGKKVEVRVGYREGWTEAFGQVCNACDWI